MSQEEEPRKSVVAEEEPPKSHVEEEELPKSHVEEVEPPKSPVEEEPPKSLVEEEPLKSEEEMPEKIQKEHMQKPLTYGDVFPAVAAEAGPIASEPITIEDASLMQTAESMAFGKTQKGGAASAMQSAAAKNVQDGLVERDAHSMVAESGLSVTETSVPGAVMDIAYVAGQPVAGSARPTPTDPAIAALDAVTIGEALEAAAVGAGDRPVDENDARAILSAEARATGISMPLKGGIGATAQSAAQFNVRADEGGRTTLADVLMDATEDLKTDKVVTYEDALKVLQAELRGRDVEDLQPGGVGASLMAAANLNELSGLTATLPQDDFYIEGIDMEVEGEKKKDVVDDGLGKYEQLNGAVTGEQKEGEMSPLVSRQDSDLLPIPKRPEGGDDSAPLVSHGSEQIPSHGSEQLPPPKHTSEV